MKQETGTIFELIKNNIKNQRKYANFFEWRDDKKLKEVAVAEKLIKSLELENKNIFYNLKPSNGEPPDCEALEKNSKRRMAIEITELVDQKTVEKHERSLNNDWAFWDKEKLIKHLEEIIYDKDLKYPDLNNGPYPGGYYLIIFSDEPELNRITVNKYLKGYFFNKPQYLTKVFLLLSHDSSIKRYPYFELNFKNKEHNKDILN